MNAYKFANLPSNSSVDSGVTMLVSVWFLVAAAAILGDPSSTYTSSDPLAVTVVAPQARETIVVQASRSATL